MKILYIGNERRDAQTVARALLGIAQSAPLAWAHSLDQCARHLAQNRDLAAIVVDAQIHAGTWPAHLRDLRSLPGRPAIVVVVPEGTPPTFDSSAPPSDESVINGPTFLTDLPNAVTRAVARVRGSQPPSTTPSAGQPQQPVRTPRERADDAFLHLEPTAQAELEQKLASLTATFQQAERRHAAAMTAAQAAHEFAATELLTEQERQFHVQIALEREKRRTVEDRLSAATSAREEAERRYASALTDAAAQGRELERIGQREAELVAQSQRERGMHAALEQKIANADAHVRDMQQRHDAALTKAELALKETQANVQGELRMAEGRLSDTVREIEEMRASYENRLAEVQSECGRLAQAGAAATKDVQRLNADLSVASERLKEETARHDAALQASERIRTELQECLQAALAAGRHDIDQIQKTLLATLEGVRASTRRQDTLQTQADRIAESHEAPDESRAPSIREARQPEIAAWHELSKDAALV